MSADNYYLIRRVGTRYAVTSESESALVDAPEGSPLARALNATAVTTPLDDPSLAWFDDLAAARAYAYGQYSEYGVREDTERDAAGDTAAARLRDALRADPAAARGLSPLLIDPTYDDRVYITLENGLVLEVVGPRELREEWVAFYEAVMPASLDPGLDALADAPTGQPLS